MAARVDPVPPVMPIYPPPPMQTNTTTVVVNQPGHGVPVVGRKWSTGLCGCFDDMGVCFFACFCPGLFMLKLASDMGESCLTPCCVPSPLIAMRAAWRNKHNIEGSIIGDCCLATFCTECAMCQLGIDVKRVNR